MKRIIQNAIAYVFYLLNYNVHSLYTRNLNRILIEINSQIRYYIFVENGTHFFANVKSLAIVVKENLT